MDMCCLALLEGKERGCGSRKAGSELRVQGCRAQKDGGVLKWESPVLVCACVTLGDVGPSAPLPHNFQFFILRNPFS